MLQENAYWLLYHIYSAFVWLWLWFAGLRLSPSRAARRHRLNDVEELEEDSSGSSLGSNAGDKRKEELLSLDEDHHMCVLLSHIWTRRRYTTKVPSRQDFLVHPAFQTNLRYLLRPTVSLYCVDQEWAYFVEVSSPGSQLYESQGAAASSQHLAERQFQHAIHLLQVSHEDWLYLAHRLKLHHRRSSTKMTRTSLAHSVVMVTGTPHCGMRLFAKALQVQSDTVILLQPGALLNLQQLHNEGLLVDPERYRALLHATLQLLCKPQLLPAQYTVDPNSHQVRVKPLRVFLCCIASSEGNGVSHIRACWKVLPEVKHLFMYRNALTSMRILERRSQALHKAVLERSARDLLPCVDKPNADTKVEPEEQAIENLQVKFQRAELQQKTLLGLCALQWGFACAVYLDALHHGVPIRGIRYEDLLAHPRDFFQHLNGDLRWGLASEKTMKRGEAAVKEEDERRELWKRETRNKPTVPTAEERAEINAILSSFGLPNWEEAAVLEHTILM